MEGRGVDRTDDPLGAMTGTHERAHPLNESLTVSIKDPKKRMANEGSQTISGKVKK